MREAAKVHQGKRGYTDGAMEELTTKVGAANLFLFQGKRLQRVEQISQLKRRTPGGGRIRRLVGTGDQRFNQGHEASRLRSDGAFHGVQFGQNNGR